MAVAVADARDARGDPCFRVVGVDLPTPPSQAFVLEARIHGATVVCHDPLVSAAAWMEWTRSSSRSPTRLTVSSTSSVGPGDARNPGYSRRPTCCRAGKRAALAALGCTVASIGRGERRVTRAR